jgi:predicted nuclease with TOPRIM domain
MREKLQFVQKNNRKLTREVAELEAELGTRRDDLGKIKQQRDKLRNMAQKMKESSVYIDNPMLLADMHQQREQREALISDIEDLQVYMLPMLRG